MDEILPRDFENPGILLSNVDEALEQIPSDQLFNDPRYEKLREAWCASMFGVGFARHIEECNVLVNTGKDRPDVDFYLKAGANVHEFQLVEVQEPGRRRGLEYRRFADGSLGSIPYEPARGHQEGPDWIVNGLSTKVARIMQEPRISICLFTPTSVALRLSSPRSVKQQASK